MEEMRQVFEPDVTPHTAFLKFFFFLSFLFHLLVVFDLYGFGTVLH